MTKISDRLKAKLSGDESVDVKSGKINGQMVSAIKVHIAVAESKTPEFEEAVQTAKDDAQDALLNNGNFMKGVNEKAEYCSRLKAARNKIVEAKEALEAHQEEIKFFKEIQDNLAKDEMPTF